MPKRRRANTAAVIASTPTGNDTLLLLPANNLPDGNSVVSTASAYEQGGVAGVREWYEKIQAVAPVPPPPSLVRKAKENEGRMIALMDMASSLSQANKRYGSEAIEQWQGLTPPVEDVICEAIALGLSRQKAAQLAGFKLSHLKTWLQLGARGYSPFENFRSRLLRSEVQHELLAMARVEEAAAVESKSAAIYLKLLERRHKADVSEDEELPESIPVEQFTIEELKAFIDSKGEIVPSRFLSVDAKPIEED